MSSPTQNVIDRLDPVRVNGRGWQAICPAHDDSKPSLSVAEGSEGQALLKCHAGCSTCSIVSAIGLTMADLFPERDSSGFDVDETYDYEDESGELLYQVVRLFPKDFRQRKPNGCDDWEWSTKGVRKVLYKLPELLKAEPSSLVFIVEGEKDVERLAKLGAVATCNPSGAGKWRDEYSEPLAGRSVVVLPDNDQTGRDHAEVVCRSLHNKASSLKLLELPNLPEAGDVSDWLKSGGTVEELTRLTESAPEWNPAMLTANPEPVGQQLQFERFPTELLGAPLTEFVESSAAAMCCDPSYVALPLLSALASAIGNTRRIELKPGWSEPSIIWTAIVGNSGTLKSPAIQLAVSSIVDKQTRESRVYETRKKTYREESQRHKRLKKNPANLQEGECPPLEPIEPVLERYWCDDTTVEAIAPILANQPRGILMVRDELSGWLESFDRYVQGKGGDVAKWLELHGGRTMAIDRKTSGYISIPHAAVSIAGGIQPEVLKRSLRREFHENGLAARLLLASPPTQPKRWSTKHVPREVQANVTRLFEALLNVPMDRDQHGQPKPRLLQLDSSGLEVWETFYNEHANEQVGLSGELAAVWSKLEGYAARLALVVHMVCVASNDSTLENTELVDAECVRAGVELARWFGREAVRIHQMKTESQQEKERRELVELIRRKGGSISTRELQQSVKAIKTAQDAEVKLRDLVDCGTCETENVRSGPKGGRPTQRFVLVESGQRLTEPRESPVSDSSVDVDKEDSSNAELVSVSEDSDDWGEI